MSEALEYVIAVGGYIVIMLPLIIVMWRRAERNARKEIAGLKPPSDAHLDEAGAHWLIDQLVLRTRWSVIAIGTLSAGLAVLVVSLRDVAIIEVTGAMVLVASIGIGYAVGGTLATLAAARTSIGARRSAPLVPRTARTYLRSWEYRLQLTGVAAPGICLVITAVLWLRGSLDGPRGAFYLGLALAWVLVVASGKLLERHVLRTPPVVDDELHIARELLISICVRELAYYQLPWAAALLHIGTSYAWLQGDISSEMLTVTPLYGAGVIAFGFYIARTTREDRGAPSPEWNFARTTRSPA